jgi:hypothetical protein
MALPVGIRSEAVKTQDKGDLLARLQVARIVEEISTAALHLHHRPGIDDPLRRAILVRTVQESWCDAGSAGQLDRLLAAGLSRERHDGDGDNYSQHSDQIA